jgi:hypothetical protein
MCTVMLNAEGTEVRRVRREVIAVPEMKFTDSWGKACLAVLHRERKTLTKYSKKRHFRPES